VKRLLVIVLLAAACTPSGTGITSIPSTSPTASSSSTTGASHTTTTHVATTGASTSAAPTVPTPTPSPPPRHVAFTSQLSLDVYGSSGPTVVLFHGGGWVAGSPEDIAPLGRSIADAGAVVFNAPYRLVFEGGGFPTTFEDAACAVRFAAMHSEEYGGDPSHLVVVGYSAGAHIAAVVALAADTFDGDCQVEMTSVLPTRLVGIAGPYDTDALGPLMEPFFGVERDADPERWALGNPLTYLGRNPDLIIRLIHGDHDTVVPLLFSEYFERQLENAGYDVTLTIIPGADHADVTDAAIPIVTDSLHD
jgi:acetyl esterase/lipase